MKHLICLGAAAILCAATSMASAADLVQIQPPVMPPPPEPGAFYMRGDVGWSFMNTNFPKNDDALTLGGGFGYRFNENFRADITGDYSGGYDIGTLENLNVWSVLGNGYVGMPFNEAVTPFVGLGVGWGWLDTSPGSDSGFTLAGHAGVSFAVTDHLDFEVSYRFRDIMIGGPDFTDHSIRAGFRVGF